MHKIVFRRELSDGRYVIVYDTQFHPFNYVAIVKQNGNTRPIMVVEMREEEQKWKDELSKALKLTKKELGLD